MNEARFQYAYSYQLGPSGAPIFTQMGVYPPERLAPLQIQLNFPSFSYGDGYADVGVETRLTVFPGFGHGLNKPKAIRAAMEENRDWFDRLLFGPAAPAVASKSKR